MIFVYDFDEGCALCSFDLDQDYENQRINFALRPKSLKRFIQDCYKETKCPDRVKAKFMTKFEDSGFRMEEQFDSFQLIPSDYGELQGTSSELENLKLCTEMDLKSLHKLG